MFEDRHIGKFRVQTDVVRDAPAVLRMLMGTMIVVRAELLWASDAIEYVALCDHFEEVPEGAEPPLYNCNVTNFDDGSLAFDWVKVD